MKREGSCRQRRFVMQNMEEQSTYDTSRVSGRTLGVGLVIGSIGVGALLMYLFDPDRGRGRRARISDQLTSKVSRFGEAVEGRARDLRNRTKGVIHELGSTLPGGRDRRTQTAGESRNQGMQTAQSNVSV